MHTPGNPVLSVVSSMLSDTIDTAIHKSLDKAIGGIVKILTEKTNELNTIH